MVLGEAGIGKSCLIDEVLRSAQAMGRLVLSGRAVQGGRPTPYRPLELALLVVGTRAIACSIEGSLSWGDAG